MKSFLIGHSWISSVLVPSTELIFSPSFSLLYKLPIFPPFPPIVSFFFFFFFPSLSHESTILSIISISSRSLKRVHQAISRIRTASYLENRGFELSYELDRQREVSLCGNWTLTNKDNTYNRYIYTIRG